jgi:2-keto-4-pentenoate hydratase/2-oxohepta-3-ene-1,7-dioic acid hydratase in catechol pathway
MKRVRSAPAVVYAAAVAAAIAGILRFAPATHAQTQKTAPPSNRPDTPFKLATFEAGGRVRIGLTSGVRLVDIAAANTYVAQKAGLTAQTMPGDMLALIEQYDRVAPRLYQIANYLKAENAASLAFAYDPDKVAFKPPIMYPANFLNIAANYRAHAEGMGGGAGRAGAAPEPAGRGGFNAAAAADIVPERDGPIVFAKSPRSCIVASGDAFYIPEGNQRIDWEGELGIVIGKQAFNVPRERAHDYVFGYSIVNDVSDRGGRQRRVVSMFPGVNWFDGKSIDRGGPFGPFIVPKEFIKGDHLRLVTKVNGVVKQEANTSEMIWNETHQIAYISQNMTLFPGDLISSGTPSGTGAERNEYLKPGDVVTIEIEGIGTLTTPMKAFRDRPADTPTRSRQ